MTTLTLAGQGHVRLATDNQAPPMRSEDDVRALIARHAGLTPLGQAITRLCVPIAMQLGLSAVDTVSLVAFTRRVTDRNRMHAAAA